jgi:hypothetical protein
MLEDEDGGPQHPEVPVPGGGLWIFVNDDLMPVEMGGIDEESVRLRREAEAGLGDAVLRGRMQRESTRPELCGDRRRIIKADTIPDTIAGLTRVVTRVLCA